MTTETHWNQQEKKNDDKGTKNNNILNDLDMHPGLNSVCFLNTLCVS